MSFFRLFRPHTVNSYNFLNNGPIFNCFIPLELSQPPPFISVFISAILLIRLKESKETAWLYSTVYAFRSKESKDTKDRRLRQFQRCKAIENWTIIKEVIAIYSMGSKESNEAHCNAQYSVQYSM